MFTTQMRELILQSLEHERGGIKVYEAALECAVDRDLHHKWEAYLGETREHESALLKICGTLSIDPELETGGRVVVRRLGEALVSAMSSALASTPGASAELVACECVVLAETKDHLNWQLIGECADALDGAEAEALREAYDRIEDQEDEHLYHSRGWCRELWLQSLDIKAVIPPLEERRHVKTAIGAARAEQAADQQR